MTAARPDRPLTKGDVLDAQMLVDTFLPGTSTETALRWAREGTIPSRKRGQKVFFLRFEVEAWLLNDPRGAEAA